MMLHYTVSDQ